MRQRLSFISTRLPRPLSISTLRLVETSPHISILFLTISQNICHRDLKPENVLLCSVDDSNPIVKITDMGLSKLVNGTVLKTFCGTPQYIAPEVVTSNGLTDSSYTLKVDCWSMGVILYILLSGTPPFSEDRNCGLNLRAQILGANFVFYPELFNNVSSFAKDLITKLLKVNPVERMSADDILRHPWLQVF